MMCCRMMAKRNAAYSKHKMSNSAYAEGLLDHAISKSTVCLLQIMFMLRGGFAKCLHEVALLHTCMRWRLSMLLLSNLRMV